MVDNILFHFNYFFVFWRVTNSHPLFFIYFFKQSTIYLYNKKTSMDRFAEAEKEGRKKVEKAISGNCINYEFTEDKYDEVDLFITGHTSKAVMEIKNRTAYTSTIIDNLGGHILEWNKYTALTSYETYKPIYTIIYDDVMLMWDVSTINEDRFITEEHKYPSKTMAKGKIIPKKVAYLKSSEAITKIKQKV